MFELAERSNRLQVALFEKIKDALRPGVSVHDLSLIFEQVAAVKVASPQRTRELRQRSLAVILDGLRAGQAGPLPGPPPTWQEINERWMA